MPLFERIFFIAFTSFAGSCSTEQAQIESKRKDIGRELAGAYYSCVQTAFASQLPTMVDRNAAIDQAFIVCKPEEAKLQALEQSRSESPKVSNEVMAGHRSKLKQELLRR
jgi:hypothetical protein